MSSAVVLRGTQLRGEQGVDEGRLSETRFTNDHEREMSYTLGNDFVSLVGKISDADSCTHLGLR